MQTMVAETDQFEVSVVMPCLNEAETLEVCIRKDHFQVIARRLRHAGCRNQTSHRLDLSR